MAVSEIDRLLAFHEIRQLADRYAVYLDARRLDELADLYVSDVRISKSLSGRDNLRRLFEGAMRSVGITFLQVGNHVIDLADDGQTATGIVYCRAEIQDHGPDSERFIIQAIQYHDTYERRDGRWYFATNRKHLLVYGADLGVNPLGLEPANWPANQTGMGSVPGDLESWQKFWDEPTKPAEKTVTS